MLDGFTMRRPTVIRAAKWLGVVICLVVGVTWCSSVGCPWGYAWGTGAVSVEYGTIGLIWTTLSGSAADVDIARERTQTLFRPGPARLSEELTRITDRLGLLLPS